MATTEPTGQLRDQVAEEVRVWLARRKMSGAELARRLGRSQTFIAKRLDGRQAFDVDDLEQVGQILGVSAADLISRSSGPFSATAPQTYEAARNGTTGSYFPAERHLVVVQSQLTDPVASGDTGRVVPDELSAQRVASVTRWAKPGRRHVPIVA